MLCLRSELSSSAAPAGSGESSTVWAQRRGASALWPPGWLWHVAARTGSRAWVGLKLNVVDWVAALLEQNRQRGLVKH